MGRGPPTETATEIASAPNWREHNNSVSIALVPLNYSPLVSARDLSGLGKDLTRFGAHWNETGRHPKYGMLGDAAPTHSK